MDHSYWHQRWEESRIGFHLPHTNILLQQHLPSLQLKANDKIFVPLCGKTLDLLYLKQHGLKILGNELSSLAVEDFFTDNNLNYGSKFIHNSPNQSSGGLKHFYGDSIEIISGDFFKLTKEMLTGTNAVYDRASFVALPENMRKQYVCFLLEVLPKPIKILLITLEYDQALKQGPPFSVSEEEVMRYYQPDFDITLLATQETPIRQRGEVSKKISMKEKVFLLQT